MAQGRSGQARAAAALVSDLLVDTNRVLGRRLLPTQILFLATYIRGDYLQVHIYFVLLPVCDLPGALTSTCGPVDSNNTAALCACGRPGGPKRRGDVREPTAKP